MIVILLATIDLLLLLAVTMALALSVVVLFLLARAFWWGLTSPHPAARELRFGAVMVLRMWISCICVCAFVAYIVRQSY